MPTPSTPKLHAALEPSTAAPPWAFGSVGDAADAELASDAALEGAGPAAGPAAAEQRSPSKEVLRVFVAVGSSSCKKARPNTGYIEY